VIAELTYYVDIFNIDIFKETISLVNERILTKLITIKKDNFTGEEVV